MSTVPACAGREQLQVLCSLLGGLAGRLATLVKLAADNVEFVFSGGGYLACLADLALKIVCLLGRCPLVWCMRLGF
jgi:hypothetical protein